MPSAFKKPSGLARSLQRWAPAVRRLLFRNPPGAGWLLRKSELAYTQHPAEWPDAPSQLERTRIHGYRALLDLRCPYDRVVYFTGEYYEHHMNALLPLVVSPGAIAVDVGANKGMISLCLAGLVGPSGRVLSFEPNPACLKFLTRNVEANDLHQVTIHAIALSDHRGEAEIAFDQDLLGQGHLVDAEPGSGDEAEMQRLTIPVERGSVACDGLPPLDFIKIDVEGHEVSVLEGFKERLRSDAPVVITEVINAFLQRAGSSSHALLRLMQSHGYTGYRASKPRRGLVRRLRLERLATEGPVPDGDYLWWPDQRPMPPGLSKSCD